MKDFTYVPINKVRDLGYTTEILLQQFERNCIARIHLGGGYICEVEKRSDSKLLRDLRFGRVDPSTMKVVRLGTVMDSTIDLCEMEYDDIMRITTVFAGYKYYSSGVKSELGHDAELSELDDNPDWQEICEILRTKGIPLQV